MPETANLLFTGVSKFKHTIRLPLTDKLRSIIEITLLEANGILQINFNLYFFNNRNEKIDFQQIGEPLLVSFLYKYHYFINNQQVDDIIKFFVGISRIRLILSLIFTKKYALTNLNYFNMPLSEFDVICSWDMFSSKCIAKTFIKPYKIYNVFSASLSNRYLYHFHNINTELLSMISQRRAEVATRMITTAINYLSYVFFIALVIIDIFYFYNLMDDALSSPDPWSFLLKDPTFLPFCIYTIALPLIRPLIPKIIFYIIQKRVEAFFLS